MAVPNLHTYSLVLHCECERVTREATIALLCDIVGGNDVIITSVVAVWRDVAVVV